MRATHRINVAAVLSATALLASPAFAATLEGVPMQVGVFEQINEDCAKGDENDSRECACRAKIHKPAVSGIASAAARKINAVFDAEFAKVHGDSHDIFCSGKQVKERDAVSSIDYGPGVDFDNCSLLAVTISYGWYNRGMAHPNSTSRSYLFSTETGERYTYRQLFGNDLGPLNRVVTEGAQAQKDELYTGVLEEALKKPDGFWFESSKIDTSPEYIYLSPKRGLEVSYNRYHYTPYVAEPLNVSLPLSLIKDDTLRACLEKNTEKTHASR